MIVFEDCPNQWSLSRPLLALILTNDAFYAQVIPPLPPPPGSVSPCVVCPLTTNGAFYAQWRGTVLQQQAQAGSAERQAKLGAAFDKLMQVLLPLPSGASAPPAGAHAPLSLPPPRRLQEVQPTLEAKNRDKFTQNLTLFRHDVKNLF